MQSDSTFNPSFEELIFEVKDGLAVVTMNRPKALNARNIKLRQELMRAYQIIDARPDIVVGILTGAGEKSFCVGMDLKEAAAEEFDPIQSRWDQSRSDAIALEAVTKPMIAAINGYALGGGLEVALCCDIRIAAEHATLGMPEALRGIMPGSGGTQRLSRLVGPSAAMEMLMTGDSILAPEAKRIGLVNQVVPGSQLLEATEAMARRIIRGAPVSLRLIKEAVRKGADMSLAQGLALELDLSNFVSLTEDSREGVKAFVEKRAPVWRGR